MKIPGLLLAGVLAVAGCVAPPTIMVHPRIQFVVWGSQPAPFESDWQKLIAAGVMDRLGEYGVTGATVVPTLYAMPALQPAVYDDIWLEHEMLNEITPAKNTMYIVVLPPGSTTEFMVAAKAQGYHLLATVPYAVAQPEEWIISHEIYETATDPEGVGVHVAGEEVGDVCEGRYEDIAGVTVQQVWSAKAGACL